MAKQVNSPHMPKAGTDKSYFGKVCKHHPDGNGERYLSNGSCIVCTRRKATKANYKIRYRNLLREARSIMAAMVDGSNEHDAKIFLAKLKDLGV